MMERRQMHGGGDAFTRPGGLVAQLSWRRFSLACAGAALPALAEYGARLCDRPAFAAPVTASTKRRALEAAAKARPRVFPFRTRKATPTARSRA